MLGVLMGRVAAIPTVVTLHNTGPNQSLPEALHTVESLVLRHAAHRVVAVGWETARVQSSRLRDRPITVIPNAVDAGCTLAPADRERIRSELGVLRDEVLVIAVGRPRPISRAAMVSPSGTQAPWANESPISRICGACRHNWSSLRKP